MNKISSDDVQDMPHDPIRDLTHRVMEEQVVRVWPNPSPALNGILGVKGDEQIPVAWADKGEELVTETDDVACLFAHELRRHPSPDSDMYALVVRDDDGDYLVIDAEGVPLCLYIDVEEDNAECPYLLKVQVLDSMPTVEVNFYTSDRTLTVRKDAYRRMEWEVPMPTRRKVREMCCYLIGAVQDFPAQSRVERVYGIGNALGVLARSSRAYGYRDFVDWLTPMTGIDPGGEGWEREKFLALAEHTAMTPRPSTHGASPTQTVKVNLSLRSLTGSRGTAGR